MKQYLLFFVVFLLLPITASASRFIQNYDYAVYTGGFYVLDAKLSIEIKDNRYKIYLDTKTHGFLNRLVPWQGIFKSDGLYENGHFIPLNHQSIAVFRGEKQEKSYRYASDGSFIDLYIEEEGKSYEANIDEAIAHNTKDILSVVLEMMTQDSCEVATDVFDGKRRFLTTINPLYEESLQASKYNIYSGASQICSVEITPKGGKWHKRPRGWLSIQEQGRQKGTLPQLWLGKVEPNGLAIPVKIKVVTQYGTLLMHLVRAWDSAPQTSTTAEK